MKSHKVIILGTSSLLVISFILGILAIFNHKSTHPAEETSVDPPPLADVPIAIRRNSSMITPTVKIAEGVLMPIVNLGGAGGRPGNYTKFLEIGGRGLDTALMYGDPTQRRVGVAVRQAKASRQDIFVTTKIPCCPSYQGWMCGKKARNSTADLERDMDLLGLDYVDLMLMHSPCKTAEQTMNVYRTMEKFLADGKARAIGVSNFQASHLKDLLPVAKVPPAVNQCSMSIGNHDDITIQFCKKMNITYQAYSPFHSPVDIFHDPDIVSIAAKYKVSAAQIVLRWIVQNDAIFVTAGMNQVHLIPLVMIKLHTTFQI